MSILLRMAMTEPARPLGLFTSAGRRRTWSDDEKAALVAESERPGTSISVVARRHGLSASQLCSMAVPDASGWKARRPDHTAVRAGCAECGPAGAGADDGSRRCA